ncbi:hypothetical protein I2483_07840 [Sporosarcina sp. E16_3]|uniref:hypothetical protein n=1 Tax=Sporosarcina sp. E16_3 TaxID=2789293 RepID=UPI001A932931|nr:hypothetical protein [Sporosarcina sp. E16_3]MBO0601570.1 hypothetical protein [Sporosarcina sp. E16_3]
MDPTLEGTSSHFDFLNAKLKVAINVEVLNMAYKLSVGALQGVAEASFNVIINSTYIEYSRTQTKEIEG